MKNQRRFLAWTGVLGVAAALGGAPFSARAQAEEDVPKEGKSLLKTTKNSEFNIPLSFDPDEAGLLLPPAEIDYDLSLNEGRDLRIGNVLIGEKTFVTSLRSVSGLNSALGGQLGPEGEELRLFLRWPEALLKSGTLEMISRTGSVLWQMEISEADVAAWRTQLEDWRGKLQGQGASAASLRSGIFATQIGISNLKGRGIPLWGQRETFRFCLSRATEKGQSRLCSRRMGVRAQGEALSLAAVPFRTKPRVLVMSRNAALKGSVPVKEGATAQFYADLADGETYEFASPPPKLDLVDLSDTSKKGLLRVSGFGIRPLNPHLILNPDQYHRLTVLLGFEPTIGDTRKFWAAGLQEANPHLFFPGEGGGVFKQRFELSEIPRASTRIHLAAESMKGTYIDGAWLTGRKQPTSKVESKQRRVEVDDEDPTLVYWKFQAKDKGKINRSYLTVSEGGKSYRSFFEMYRAYGNELSVRTSGIASAEGFLLMGEVAYNHWFENILWWDQYWLTKQRWGLSAKMFKSMNQLPVGEGAHANLDVMNLDLKYRLSPGLWTRDESVGAMLSYQDVSFGEIKAPMVGFGGFWARSMPRSLDTLLNYLPFMNYPKWVDMEFIYYAQSMKADTTLQGTMALNFHGQVLWKDNFFGEAGFGFKRYGITDQGVSQEAKLNTVYGTVGLGVKF